MKQVGSTNEKPLRVALIGCGAIAEQMHLPVLAGHEQLQLTALVDRDKARAERLAKGYGIGRVFDDTSALTSDIVDAVIIATPPSHHARCAIELMRRGLHVLVEKPIAATYADASAMVEASESNGVILSVGLFRRLYPSIRLMKGMLDSGWPGRPLRFTAGGGGMYSWSAATLGNMRREHAGGGVLIDFGSHIIDLLFSLFTGPAQVLEYRDNSQGGVEADCTIQARMTGSSGEAIDGTIELARTRDVGNYIRVQCERATLEFAVNERFQIKVTPAATSVVDPATQTPRAFQFDAGWSDETASESWYATFGRQYADWLAAIREGREPMLSGRSSLPTVRFIEDCYSKPTPMPEPWVRRSAGEASNGGWPAVYAGGRQGRILLTGATGFIGSRVAEVLKLREKCDVRAVVHNPANASRLARLDIELVQGDLSSAHGAERLVDGCDAVVHCAIGTDWGDPKKIYQVTVDGTRRLAEAAAAAGVKRFIHVSTMSVYGDDNELTGIIDESMPAKPNVGSVYGKSKADAEAAVLKLAAGGLPAVVFRPARVFGPFSRIFITRPLPAIRDGRFEWLGNPDIPCDMTYVDNVVEAFLAALFVEPAKVAGEVFNISDGDASTWRDFYGYFTDRLNLSLADVPVQSPRSTAATSALRSVVSFPGAVAREMRQIVTSREFKAFGNRVLQTDSVGALPRKALQWFPGLERGVRSLIKADGSLPIYRRETSPPGETVRMGSAGALLNIDKLRDRLGFTPPVSRDEALELTLDWVRYARIV